MYTLTHVYSTQYVKNMATFQSDEMISWLLCIHAILSLLKSIVCIRSVGFGLNARPCV